MGSKVVRRPKGDVARQPEGKVARQAKFFQPTQPTPSPNRDRLVRLDDMQDGRNTSRSQEINVNSVNEGLSSSDRTERPVVSEDKMSVNVEQTHDRTERPHDSQVCHLMKYFVKEWINPLLFMTKIMNR